MAVAGDGVDAAAAVSFLSLPVSSWSCHFSDDRFQCLLSAHAEEPSPACGTLLSPLLLLMSLQNLFVLIPLVNLDFWTFVLVLV